jgi:hypothetical protein
VGAKLVQKSKQTFLTSMSPQMRCLSVTVGSSHPVISVGLR